METGSTGKSEMLDSLRRHIRICLADRGVERSTPVVIACSGGRDSVVLVDAVVNAGYENVTIAHVDHGIRTASERTADRNLVQNLARRLGVPVRFRVIQPGEVVAGASARNESIEAVARHRRYEELQQTIGNGDGRPVSVLLTAHHDGDVAESVLMRIFSGRSPSEPLGIDADTVVDGVRVVRPLLGVNRTVISQYATDLHLAWAEDGTNADHRYLRNFVRHALIPGISERFPSVEAHLARFHREHREMQRALAELIPGDAWGNFGSDTEWNVSRTTFTELPQAAREFVLRRAHKAISSGVRSSFRPILRSVDELLSGDKPVRKRQTVPVGDVEIVITDVILTLRARIVRPAESGYLLEVPEGGRIRFRRDAQPTTVGENSSSPSEQRSLGPLVPPVVVRAMRSGDRLVNGGTERAWKELFRNPDSQSAAESAHVIEDMRGTVAMVRSPGECVTRDGVSVRSSAFAGGCSVCVQFND
ncbi:MAG: tRNA lysidine(34) synthetase TilS [Spirochaeta sp.]|jgi:tRNA(Ile)-lysidine synthetase-like protein|nr:tRNA lysidine(34) synthetase TilS [Spirochaeta sp.]